jgi:integrase
MLQAYIRLKMLIGIRRGDMLRLRMSDITDAGITVRPHKTLNSSGLARTFEWTPAADDGTQSNAKLTLPGAAALAPLLGGHRLSIPITRQLSSY